MLEVLQHDMDYASEYAYPIIVLTEDKIVSDHIVNSNIATVDVNAPDPRFPIGEFDKDFGVSPELRNARIAILADLPSRLRDAVSGLSDSQLDTEYRPDGWTIRQVVHHVPDSHANALIRFKLALTEDEPPTIKPYMEDRWAKLGDAKMPVEVSLKMIEAIHERWIELLNSMSYSDFQKEFIHPETGKWTLDGALALYAWHSEHHTAHITNLRERNNW
ncbi:MAG: YfiT family bacillithiol transferase [Pyrinomonadaceae bacterium]